MTWMVTVPWGTAGMVTLPSWLVFVSHSVLIFLRFTPTPCLKRTITLARSIGLPDTAEFTWTVSFVISAGKATIDARRIKRLARILRMAPLCDIGQQERSGNTRGLCDCFSGEIAAANRALHGGGPARSRPVSCQEQIG